MKQLFLFFLICIAFRLVAQQTIPLYTGAIPNSTNYAMKEIRMENNGILLGYRSISQPTLSVYLPEAGKEASAAVIICPGGGYGMESFRLEGTIIAETFAKNGIAAFILKYRLPSDSIMKDKSVGPLQDAQQAIKIVRERSKEWNINRSKIGIMGFSAGGHLASTAGTHFEKAFIPNENNTSLRPDFMVLVYPVISMTDELTHGGSRKNLLGLVPSPEQIRQFSNEMQVNPGTPPAWITHTGDDTVVPVENSIRFYQALIRNKVVAEMHLYPSGNHGFVLKLPADEWMKQVFSWMTKSGF